MINFGLLQLNIEIYKSLFALFILAFSFITYYFYKKDNKVKKASANTVSH